MLNILVSSVCKAFDKACVGTKVLYHDIFRKDLEEVVGKFQFPENGQGFIPMPHPSLVSCGVANRTKLRPEDFVVRGWRGNVSMFADRAFAAMCEHLNVVVYTKEAYLADPDVDAEEREEVKDATHVLVAVLGSAGPKPPLSPYRFVANLAGGNNRYKPENGYSLEQAIKEAQEIVAYERTWITVAD